MITDFLKANNIAVVVKQPHALPRNVDDDVNMPYKNAGILANAEIIRLSEEKVAQFQQQRNAKNAAATAMAARNLATNLRGSGFNVSTSDLMRSLQAPAPSLAEEQ